MYGYIRGTLVHCEQAVGGPHLGDAGVGGVHHERPLALHVAAVTHLTLAAAHVARRLHLLHVGERTALLQQLDRLGCLGDALRVESAPAHSRSVSREYLGYL